MGCHPLSECSTSRHDEYVCHCHHGKVLGELLEAGGDAAELLQAPERIFDEMAGFVAMQIVCTRALAVQTRPAYPILARVRPRMGSRYGL